MAEPSGQAPKPPKVSALVVSYNRKALLRRAIEALERSEARDTIEIVVVDNGSTDGSQQLESDFPRVRFIRIPRNFGLTKALNLGVRGSEGEYVFFLHEDTEVFPETLRLLAGLLDAQPGCRCGLPAPGGCRRTSPAPQLGKFPPDDTWRPAEPGPEPAAGRLPARRRAHDAPLFLHRHPPDRRALRPVRQRCGPVLPDPPRRQEDPAAPPGARAATTGARASRALRMADRKQGTAAWIGKYGGFWSGLRAQIGAIFGALGSLQLAVLKYLLAGQKVDGSQQE